LTKCPTPLQIGASKTFCLYLVGKNRGIGGLALIHADYNRTTTAEGFRQAQVDSGYN
jgi:hypothetical protein